MAFELEETHCRQRMILYGTWMADSVSLVMLINQISNWCFLGLDDLAEVTLLASPIKMYLVL